MPLKIKEDLEKLSDSDSAKVLSDGQGHILTSCMFDVLLNLVTVEKSQVILHAACG